MIKYQQRTQFISLFFLICNLLIISSAWSVENTEYRTKNQIGLKQIEFAKTADEKALGLMYRKQLCHECAMLFIYDQLGTDVFWMKDTSISLDIIFIDQDGKVVAIHPKTEPLNTAKLYKSPVKYKYVLEANAGFAAEKDIKLNSNLDMPSFLMIN